MAFGFGKKKVVEVEEEPTPVILTTGDIRDRYEIIDAIFAFDGKESVFLFGIQPAEVFSAVKGKLMDECRSVGGDAVVHCQFEYRNSLADGFFGKKQSLEIFAYGTAVRMIPMPPPPLSRKSGS